jgi:putative membrane protein
MRNKLQPSWSKNDKAASVIIYTVSIIVFITVVVLSKVKLIVNLGFDVHIFAVANAIINSLVAVLLLIGLMAIKQKKYLLHKRVMLAAIVFSVLFLLSYIAHHLLAGDTKFGDINHDGILSIDEKLQAGNMRFVYLILLFTHIPLAAIILPFILFTAYRALIGEYDKHKKIVRFTWPIWFYVAISGVLVYWMISPYYS